MIYVVNYADGEPFSYYRNFNTKTAYIFGKADKVIEYRPSDISQEYKEKFNHILSQKRGAGLWLWKPYIISLALNSIEDGDWLFYTDSGSIFINPIEKLIHCVEKSNTDIITFELPLLNRQFTKRECYMTLGLDDNGENQALGILLLRKSQISIQFVDEWLSLCENEVLLSPVYYRHDVEEWPDFYSHREDQSLLSILRNIWKLQPYRDPSDYGEMPFMYSGNGRWAYNPQEYSNSDYPTIILINRKENPLFYYCKFLVKHYLHMFGLYYTEDKILQKRGIHKYEKGQ